MIADPRGNWTQTASGSKLYALDPRPEDMNLLDAARGLASRSRWGGQFKRRGMWYSVAEHSVIVSIIAERVHGMRAARHGLCHDIGEAHGFGDIQRPLKYQPHIREVVESVEHPIAAAYYERYDIDTESPGVLEVVKEIDDRIGIDESNFLMRDPSLYAGHFGDLKPLGVNLACMMPGHAEYVFLQRFRECFPECEAEVERCLREEI